MLIDACNNTVSNCLNCNGTTCIGCESEYYLIPEINQCFQCGQNCLNCTSLSQCTLCQQGFYNNNNNSGQCQQCLPQCLNCSSGSGCDQCADAYYFAVVMNQSMCYPCPLGCATCSNSSFCLTCTTVYSYLTGSCLFMGYLTSCPSEAC